MPDTSCKALIKDYCANCTFAGIHFIADDTKHWTERLFWIILVILSWYGSAVLIIAAWDSFCSSPISFGVETTYIDWDTTFPAVAVCEYNNLERVYNVSDTIWPLDHAVDLEEVLKELAYFRGTSYYTLSFCNRKDANALCPQSNFSYYANLVRSQCQYTMTNCSYSGRIFDCCEYFLPIETDVGRCYVINSVQTDNPKRFPMVSNNKRNRRAFLKMEMLVPAKVYTIGDDEIPAVTTVQSATLRIEFGVAYKRHISVRNIENDPLVVETSPEQRACRLHSENQGGVYPYYSYSACTILCRKRAQLESCQCNDHFMPGTSEDERCNMSGLACLNQHYSKLSVLRPRWANRPGLLCDCLPSCTETEVTVIKDEKTPYKYNKAKVEIVLDYLPKERFKRNVIRSRLDLVVSVGGTIGLFVGASLLSFMELIFYFTVRFCSNIWMEGNQRRQNQNDDDIDRSVERVDTALNQELHYINQRTYYALI